MIKPIGDENNELAKVLVHMPEILFRFIKLFASNKYKKYLIMIDTVRHEIKGIRKPLNPVECSYMKFGPQTKYGVKQKPYKQKVRINPDPMIETVLVDQDGKEV